MKNPFKRLWKWLKKLFQKEGKSEIKIKEESEKPEAEKVEEVEAEEVKESEEPEAPKTPVQLGSSGELLGSSFSEEGKRGFIRVYGTESFERVVHEHFHTIDGLLKCLSTRAKNSVMGRHNQSMKAGYDFTGTYSYKEAVELFLNGYDKILPEIKSGVLKNTAKFKELFVGTKSKPIADVVGSYPDVPKYLMGLPQSMNDRTREVQKVKTIDIIYAPQGPWYIDSRTFIQGGIAVLSAIQILENTGISISLSCTMYTGYENEEAVIGTVQLKDYKDRLDLKKLCFPIAHPSMLRRIGFRFLETVPEITEPYFARGYGDSPSHDALVEMLKIRPNIVVLSLQLIDKTLRYDVKQIITYIKENAKR